ncbi:SGNH/GDSL hydrolase family protein [Acinetobacter sp. WCHAc060033]|uniref:SGNH/GDSL hydrolase family protein n=1 Tax=Acinetobacter sp. WCHAc060033 TaxID=2518624 RepID=UPI0010235A33|nr:SGNH/GDSL hydrolase family protein [Acinetobacter sp. WCHAc060033]RZG79952.1 SGNH/GDSL hydrolase family protein [Acinetobacter sp. WCHAc060033]
MFLKISTVALIPALLIQGYHVKKNTLRLPEAIGIRYGKVGQGKPLSILILGDSAAAGVGVETQSDALLGAVLDELKQDFEISYQLEAKTGDTTLQVLERTQLLESHDFDVVITSVGVNDVTKLSSPKKWIQQQQNFYKEIENKFTPKLVLVTGVPPMNLFPALPNPLGWLFGQYSSEMNQKLAQFVKSKSNYQLIQFDLAHFNALDLDMAEDGFHPSKEIYQLWAGELANKIRAYLK